MDKKRSQLAIQARNLDETPFPRERTFDGNPPYFHDSPWICFRFPSREFFYSSSYYPDSSFTYRSKACKEVFGGVCFSELPPWNGLKGKPGPVFC